MAFIYALTYEDEIRYIGCTSCSLNKRYKEHLRCQDNTYKQKWIKSLLKKGKKPNIKLIEEVDLDILFEREKYWISYHKNKSRLTNLTDGGEGVLNYKPSKKIKEKISKNTRRAMKNPLIREKLRKAKTGKPAKNKKKLKDQYGNIYSSLTEAAEKHNISISAISLGLKENRPVKSIKFEAI